MFLNLFTHYSPVTVLGLYRKISSAVCSLAVEVRFRRNNKDIEKRRETKERERETETHKDRYHRN